MNLTFVDRAATIEITTYTHGVKSALRKAGVFIRHETSVGLEVPPGASASRYADAVRSVLRANNRADLYTQITVEASKKGHGEWQPAADVLISKPGVVLIIPNGISVPREIRIALDEIIRIKPMKAAHVAAAIKSATGIPASIDEAEALMRYPPELMFSALRPGRSITHALARLSTNDEVQQEAPRTPERGVEDLPGFGKATTWALELADDIRAWSAGTLEWQDVDCGLLLSGPPGTGKTTFAAAVAETCGASFISASCAQWQSHGHLGDFLKAMNRSFADAAEKAPCILFLDEFDAVGNRSKFQGDNASYGVQVVNGLLEALDGSKRRDGVVVIAATNHPDAIDPALRRPGRLDRHIEIELPSFEARKGIIALHLRAEVPDDVLAEAARATSGYSGADLAQLAKDARKRARRGRRSVSAEDLKAATPPLLVIDDTLRYAACVHEAGHAVVGTELGFGSVEIITVLRELSLSGDRAGYVGWLRPNPLYRSRDSYLNEIAMFMAGHAAEAVIVGSVSDGFGGSKGSDLHRATDVATLMEANLGLGQGLSYSSVNSSEELEKLRRSDPVLRRRVERLLGAELERAKSIVLARRQHVEALAKNVFETGVMGGRDVELLLAPFR
ncbi:MULTISPECIES: AAA family ATPase [Agrobacterium]|uniref:AAA family ATPase n=1 Tax=Agrobacterium tumefaciens TaxID=358 RepID=UPI001572F067|nr:AAA family ATPase [Agrobacterium tumefaciens]NSZ06333.1 AAA family ATPase [Agrobacterium tumefaciens]